MAARRAAAGGRAAARSSDALFAASRHKEVGLHFNKGLARARRAAIAAALDTATNPAVTEAFALAIIADGEAPAYPGMRDAPRGPARPPTRTRSAIDAGHARSCAGSPRSAGSYVSESNYFNAQLAAAPTGASTTRRLRAVKDKYDPDGLFFVHHGVGSEEWSADGFTRIA